MKLAIIGTRGIPNHYGGFEQCAEYLAAGLVKRGFDVTVYCSHNHPYQNTKWSGVNLIHCYDPEFKYGTAGQFLYDFNCIKDSRNRDFDIILQLGYTSSSIWGKFLPKKAIVTTNMDGLEWKRTKFSKKTQQFLKYAERLAIKYSDYLIADSIGIEEYIQKKYKLKSTYIPYGAHLFNNPDSAVLIDYKIAPYKYNMLVARLEPENSIEIILDGASQSLNKIPFLVIGKNETKYGEYLKNKYQDQQHIIFLGGIYDIQKLNNLRHFSDLYFHGHTVGGTNPSLLEAMGSSALICAHNNPFNRYILNDDAYYFVSPKDVANFINKARKEDKINQSKVENNRIKIKEVYSWEKIINLYESHFYEISGGATLKRAVNNTL